MVNEGDGKARCGELAPEDVGDVVLGEGGLVESVRRAGGVRVLVDEGADDVVVGLDDGIIVQTERVSERLVLPPKTLPPLLLVMTSWRRIAEGLPAVNFLPASSRVWTSRPMFLALARRSYRREHFSPSEKPPELHRFPALFL